MRQGFRYETYLDKMEREQWEKEDADAARDSERLDSAPRGERDR